MTRAHAKSRQHPNPRAARKNALARRRREKVVLRTPQFVPEHRYDLTRPQIDLIKRTIAKDATDDELQLFLWTAKRHRLDPFTRQLHLVKRWSTQQNCHIMTIQVGIDGYRQMASRYPDFGATLKPVYGPIKKVGNIEVPEWAEVAVLKKGMTEPTVGVAYWNEYAPDLGDKDAWMWRKMPRGQLAKCAEALALRKAHPDLADVYTTEEMTRHNIEERTPSGRELVIDNPVGEMRNDSAHDRYKQREAEQIKALPAADRAEVEKRMGETGERTYGPSDEPHAAMTPAIFYQLQKQNGFYVIAGDENLMHENRDLLVPLWSQAARCVMANPQQLGKLIKLFEDRKIPFRPVEAR